MCIEARWRRLVKQPILAPLSQLFCGFGPARPGFFCWCDDDGTLSSAHFHLIGETSFLD